MLFSDRISDECEKHPNPKPFITSPPQTKVYWIAMPEKAKTNPYVAYAKYSANIDRACDELIGATTGVISRTGVQADG